MLAAEHRRCSHLDSLPHLDASRHIASLGFSLLVASEIGESSVLAPGHIKSVAADTLTNSPDQLVKESSLNAAPSGIGESFVLGRSHIKEAENDIFSEPGLVWIRADGRLYLIDITNMPWARPDLETLMPKAKFAVENNYPARGTNAD